MSTGGHSTPSASNLRIRPANPDDAGAIAAIYAHHVLHGSASFETEPPSSEEIRRRMADILARGLPYLIVETPEGRVLGYAYAGPYRPRAAYRNTVENSVYVRHDMVGRGIGRRLLTELIARCEASGLRQMIAVVGDSANTTSIKLHEALGFRLAGTLRSVGYKHGRWLDSVLLQCPLGEGDAKVPEI